MDACQRWLDSLTGALIPRAQFEISYSRASGKGGQKVNKTSSKATIRTTKEAWEQSSWIPRPVMHKLLQGFRYATESGNIVIQSDLTRSQLQNTEACFDKLAKEIRETVSFPKAVTPQTVEKWNQIQTASQEKRLEAKRRQGQKKSDRKSHF